MINQNPMAIPPVNACGCNAYGLASAGLALRWRKENVFLLATYALGLGGNPGRSAVTGENADGSFDNSQFWLQAGLRF